MTKVIDYDERELTLCSPSTSSSVWLSRDSSFPWWIKRWRSLEGFESRESRILSLSWAIVVEAGSRGKLRGVLAERDGETMAMLTERSSEGPAADDASSAMPGVGRRVV